MATDKIKISGEIHSLSSKGEYRLIALHQGGVVALRDWHLIQAGFKEGDKVTITIEPCGENEFYYQKPKDI